MNLSSDVRVWWKWARYEAKLIDLWLIFFILIGLFLLALFVISFLLTEGLIQDSYLSAGIIIAIILPLGIAYKAMSVVVFIVTCRRMDDWYERKYPGDFD